MVTLFRITIKCAVICNRFHVASNLSCRSILMAKFLITKLHLEQTHDDIINVLNGDANAYILRLRKNL